MKKIFFRFIILKLLILPVFINAQSCKMKEDDSNETLKKVKEYLKLNPASSIDIFIEEAGNKCKLADSVYVTIVNNSDLPIDEIDFGLGSWLEKSNGKSYYVGKIIYQLKDSKYMDFYIKPHQKYSFCSEVNLEEKENVLLGESRLIHKFEFDELNYGLVKDSCFVGFDD